MKTSLFFATVVMLFSTGSAYSVDCQTNGNIDGGATIDESCSGSYVVRGKIDGNSRVKIVSQSGNIRIDNKIDGRSHVKLVATNGDISIGDKIDGASSVCLVAKGNVDIADKIDNSETIVYWTGMNAQVHKGVNGGARFLNQSCPW